MKSSRQITNMKDQLLARQKYLESRLNCMGAGVIIGKTELIETKAKIEALKWVVK